MATDLSIITATWKRPELLFHTCMAVDRQQDRDFTLEHIVVSDGPDRNAQEVCEQFRVRYHELPEHKGRLGAFCKDAGVTLATGEYVAFWDDDNAWTLDAAATQWENAQGVDLGVSSIIHREMGWIEMPRKWNGSGMPTYADIDTACVCVRRTFAQRVRWQDQPLGDDDWHWACKLIALKAAVRLSPAIIGYHL